MTVKGDRFRYSDDELREIACRLKKAGIDADLRPGGALHRELALYAALFHQRHVHGVGALLRYLTGLPQSNVDAMQGTPKQKAAALDETLKKIAAARDTLEESGIPYERLKALTREMEAVCDLPRLLRLDKSLLCQGSDEMADIAALAAADRVLQRRAAVVRQHRDALLAEGSRSADNARQLRTTFWIVLANWIRVAGRGRRLRENHMRNILSACSSPVFPDETTESALSYFTKHYYHARTGEIRAPEKR
jgi:hypothetical protein